MRLGSLRARLSDRRPASVRVAARGAARDLRLTIDIDAVGVVAALGATRLIGRTRNYRTVALRALPAPADRNARLAMLKRLHLGRIGALAVAFVEAGADRTTKDAPGDA